MLPTNQRVVITLLVLCYLSFVTPSPSKSDRHYHHLHDSPSLSVNVTSVMSESWVNVSWSGVKQEYLSGCWIGLFVSDANVTAVDFKKLSEDYTYSSPFTATAPIKYFMCQTYDVNDTGSGQKDVYIVNFRKTLRFWLFSNGLDVPVSKASSDVISIIDIDAPNQGHLSRTMNPMEMRVSWVSRSNTGDFAVRWGTSSGYYSQTSHAEHPETYTMDDLCVGGPATSVGWFSPPNFYTAIISLRGVVSTIDAPQTPIFYIYGSSTYGWSSEKSFLPPLANSVNATTVIFVMADVGVHEADDLLMHWPTPPARQTIFNIYEASKKERNAGALLIGDVSYATGYLSKWEMFMSMIEPFASEMPLHVVLGNHERDFPNSGSSIGSADSGGECGIPTSFRFRMPGTDARQVLTYYRYIEGNVAIVMVDSEIPVTVNSPQHSFLLSALAVDRSITPWLIVGMHRPLYGETRITDFSPLEDLFIKFKVDLVLQGHEHDAQVTCPVAYEKCVDQVDAATGYDAPVYLVIGNGGKPLSKIPTSPLPWHRYYVGEYGWHRLTAVDQSTLKFDLFGEEHSHGSTTNPHYTVIIKRDWPRKY